ncbi:MAG TPA: DUF222 domain-containing protein [Lacisediminihabitans sp.]|uniref:HNH endonuclease signature motif containing protein n=1 Tax=Lacisediminihabitans sp. TaxID=2787631 RepID=UPI002EDA8EAE
MNTPTGTLLAAAARLDELWLQRTGAFLPVGSSPASQVESMTDDGLESTIAELGFLQRSLDALRVLTAGELAERSRPSLGGDGLAKRAGYARPSLLLAARWGLSPMEASRFCEVGLVCRPRRSLDGQPLPSRYPAVSAGISSCELGVTSAAIIVRELQSASLRCSEEARLEGEAFLVDWAPTLSTNEITTLARQIRDRLDHDGLEPRDELHRARRRFRLTTASDGMVDIHWRLEPAEGGLVRAEIDAIVTARLRRGTDDACSAEGGVAGSPPDEVTLEQMRSDAAMEVFRHAMTCTAAAGDLPSTTVVVRMTLESLLTGLGAAEIDGVGETISAAGARRLAADAEIIPVVLGGRGEVLDVGAAQRLFTRAQRLAFAERDGGCAWAGCATPPSYAEAHHIDWWEHSHNSDLSNGLLLCSHHHHQIHDHGWQVFVDDNVPYFIPPPRIDPGRRPRRGGRIAVDRMRV